MVVTAVTNLNLLMRSTCWMVVLLVINTINKQRVLNSVAVCQQRLVRAL